MNRREAVTVLLAVLLPLPACAQGVPEITFDLDSCEHCRMTISDRRYAAALTTAGGRVVRFDSIECLAAWVTKATEAPKALWVTDAMAPGTLVALGTVRFHRGAPGSSPMGMGFIAVGMDRGTTPWDGPVLTWSDVTTAVATEGFGGGGGHAGH
jgi:copper chaperone NosL